MNRAAPFPCKNLLSQTLPQFPYCFHDMLAFGGSSPLSPKTGSLTGNKQVGGPEPTQESGEIREQINSFTILHWTSVQKIQSQVVSEEEEAVPPVGFSDCFG